MRTSTCFQEYIFLHVVRAMHSIGYGRMLQLVSHEWYRAALHDETCPPSGVLVCPTAFGLLDKHEQDMFKIGYASDWIIHDTTEALHHDSPVE